MTHAFISIRLTKKSSRLVTLAADFDVKRTLRYARKNCALAYQGDYHPQIGFAQYVRAAVVITPLK